MRRADVLIYEARRISRNLPNADGTKSISDDEALIYLNDAQDRLQNLISAEKNIAKIFVKQALISIVADQESYTIPDRLLLNKQIEMVEFSYDGQSANYTTLEKVNLFDRDTNTSNYPWGYYKRGGEIFLVPTPSVSTGTLRVTYERDLDDLDIPRGVISAIGSGTSTQFASLTLNATADSYETTTPGWNTQQYCSIVSPLGARKCYNILISNYAANVITPNPNPFIYDTTYDSEITTGDVAVFNKYTTTFSQLPDSCERYLIHYTAAELFKKDSSNDYDKEKDVVASIESDVIKALKAQTSEIQFVPQLGNEWF